MKKTKLELYKPTADISKIFEIDEKLPDNELTFVLFKNLTIARKIESSTFIVMGRMLKIVRDRKLYKYLDFDDFSQFLASEELSFSREKAYACIRIYELYIEKLQLSPDDISKLGIARLMMLVPVIKDIVDRKDAIKKIEESKDLRYNDFVRKVKDETNKTGKPNVYWSKETEKWIVQFFENITHLINIGDFEKKEGEKNGK